MITPPFPILYEDNHLLIVNKPAGLPTMGAVPGQVSVYDLAKQYIKQTYNKPGEVYLGIVSRLDAAATGVLVLARTSKAAARLSELFRKADVEKTYWAIVERQPVPAAGTCVDWLVKNEAQQKVVVVRSGDPQAREARLRYETIRPVSAGVLLEIHLETGRKHQIRVQLASRGWPILGDRKYGSRRVFPAGIALHSRRIEFIHPVRKTPLEIVAPEPPDWNCP